MVEVMKGWRLVRVHSPDACGTCARCVGRFGNCLTMPPCEVDGDPQYYFEMRSPTGVIVHMDNPAVAN